MPPAGLGVGLCSAGSVRSGAAAGKGISSSLINIVGVLFVRSDSDMSPINAYSHDGARDPEGTSSSSVRSWGEARRGQ